MLLQVRSLDTQLHPERLKVITQQVEEEQALLQSQTLLRLQQIHAADRQTHSPQVRNVRTHTRILGVFATVSRPHVAAACMFDYFISVINVLPVFQGLAPASTHHPTVIVPAPTLTQHPHHHVTVVTMSPSAHTSTVSTSRQNLDTIVQVSACFTLYRESLWRSVAHT